MTFARYAWYLLVVRVDNAKPGCKRNGGERTIKKEKNKILGLCLLGLTVALFIPILSAPAFASSQSVRSIMVAVFDSKGNLKGYSTIDAIAFICFYDCRSCPCSTYEIIRRIIDVITIPLKGTIVNLPPWGVRVYFGSVYTRSALGFWLPGPYVVPINYLVA